MKEIKSSIKILLFSKYDILFSKTKFFDFFLKVLKVFSFLRNNDDRKIKK